MATPETAMKGGQGAAQAELADELARAEEDFARGDFVELTVEDLDRSMAAGEWPWRRASSE